MHEDPFSPPPGVGIIKFKFLLWMRYFQTGYGSIFSNIFKYAIALFGLSSQDVKSTMALGFFYVIFCFAFGWWWYYFKFIEIENEISNRFNWFMREMRDMRSKVANGEKL